MFAQKRLKRVEVHVRRLQQQWLDAAGSAFTAKLVAHRNATLGGVWQGGVPSREVPCKRREERQPYNRSRLLYYHPVYTALDVPAWCPPSGPDLLQLLRGRHDKHAENTGLGSHERSERTLVG